MINNQSLSVFAKPHALHKLMANACMNDQTCKFGAEGIKIMNLHEASIKGRRPGTRESQINCVMQAFVKHESETVMN